MTIIRLFLLCHWLPKSLADHRCQSNATPIQVGFALPLAVMMFVSFYDFVPDELVEAAIVDNSIVGLTLAIKSHIIG